MTGCHLDSDFLQTYRHNYVRNGTILKKDVSTQVWQAAANTDVMLHNRFNKNEVLATLQCTNSSFGFLPEKWKLLRAEEAHIKSLLQTSLKYSFFLGMQIYTSQTPTGFFSLSWNADNPINAISSVPEKWGCDCYNSPTGLWMKCLLD